MPQPSPTVTDAVRDRLGEERSYATDFGERAFAIAVLVGRERARGGVNGERLTIRAHRNDGRLELRRERDGAAVLWDLHEHRVIDPGYATTSYRSQVVPLTPFSRSPRPPMRGAAYTLTLREPRGDVTIVYGKDDVRDFSDPLVRAQRDDGKMLVRDVVHDVNIRLKREEELKRRRESGSIKI